MEVKEILDVLDPKMKEYKEGLAQEAKAANDAAKAAKDAVDAQKAEIETLKSELNEVKAKAGRPAAGKAEVKSFEDEFAERKSEVKEVITNHLNKEIEIKANTLRASVATNNHYLTIDGVGQLQRKARSLYNFFPKIQVGGGNHNGTITYMDWDEATAVKAAAMVAEGAAFPESTAAFKMYTLPLRKIGDTLPVSEEFFEDEQLAASELALFLATNVEDKIDNEIVAGDGTGQRLTGLFQSVGAYTAVASGITDANIYDLVIKVAESITSVGGAKYRPDFVAMNIADINKLKLKKTTFNNYVFDRQDERLQQLNIIEDNNITANTLVVGDSRFARIYEMGGVVLSRGEVNAQFTSDMTTIKARKRLAFLIRTADATGFRKVNSISAALVTLAT